MNRIISSSVCKAVCDQDVERLKTLIDAGKRVDIQDNLGWTSLHFAVHKNSLDMVELLSVHPCAPINVRSFEGETPLLLACQEQRSSSIVSTLLIAGADPNIPNNVDIYPLHLVKQIEIAELLLTFGANLNTEDFNVYTPLHCAVEKNQPELVRIFLEAGANPNVKELNGLNPFMLALTGNIDCAWPLVKYSDVNCVAEDGWSALMLAINIGKLDLAYELIKNGADVNISAQKITALHLAVMRQEVVLFTILWELIDFKLIAKTHSLFHLMLIHRWYLPERLNCLFKVLETPLLHKMLDYRQSFLGFLFSFEMDSILEITLCDIVRRILNISSVVSPLEIITFIENSSGYKYKFEVLDLLLKSKADFDQPNLVLLATEYDPHLVPKLLNICISISPIHIFKFFSKIERCDIHMLKLTHYILRYCTPNVSHRSTYIQKLHNLNIENLHDITYTLRERAERIVEINKIVNYSLEEEEKQLMIYYSGKILKILLDVKVPSLREIARDAVRTHLTRHCHKMVNCDLSKLGVPAEILDIITCKSPVNNL